MLFDPKWDKSAEQEPSVAGFIRWLETKDPQQKYDWRLYQTCAVGEYAAALGLSVSECICHPKTYFLSANIARGRGPKFPQDWTYGACLQRAREIAHC
jgi:hypothetical protein